MIPRNVLVVAFPIDEGLLCAQQIVDNGLVSPAYKTYKIDEKIVFPRILELILRSDKSISYYLSKMRGTTLRRRTLPEEEFQSMLIDLPSMSMQKHFIKMLEQIDVVKIICKQIFQLFDDLVKSRFIELFGDLKTNSKHWELKKLSEVAEMPLHYGSTASAIDYDGVVRYVRITDIGTNGKLNDDFKSPSEFDEKYLINKGDILFARSGSIGLTYEYSEDYRSIFAGYLIRFIPNKKKLNPTFVYYFTRTDYCQSILLGSKRGGVQKNVNAKQLGDIVIPIPPMDLQESFVAFVEQVDKSKFEVVQSLLRLKSKYIRTETPSKRTDCDL